MKKIVFFAIVVAAMASCNVTRTVTTTAEYRQKGDTTVIIQSKIVETCDATKKF